MRLSRTQRELISLHAVTCIAQIIDAVRGEGGRPFLEIAEQNMASLVKQVLKEREHRAPARGNPGRIDPQRPQCG
jgi:hypothetical protein